MNWSYTRLAARYLSNELDLSDLIRFVDKMLVFSDVSLMTDLFLFQQIQRHYQKINITLQRWDSLKYDAFISSRRCNKNKIHLIDCKTLYHLDLIIIWRKLEQIHQRQRQEVWIRTMQCDNVINCWHSLHLLQFCFTFRHFFSYSILF